MIIRSKVFGDRMLLAFCPPPGSEAGGARTHGIRQRSAFVRLGTGKRRDQTYSFRRQPCQNTRRSIRPCAASSMRHHCLCCHDHPCIQLAGLADGSSRAVHHSAAAPTVAIDAAAIITACTSVPASSPSPWPTSIATSTSDACCSTAESATLTAVAAAATAADSPGRAPQRRIGHQRALRRRPACKRPHGVGVMVSQLDVMHDPMRPWLPCPIDDRSVWCWFLGDAAAARSSADADRARGALRGAASSTRRSAVSW